MVTKKLLQWKNAVKFIFVISIFWSILKCVVFFALLASWYSEASDSIDVLPIFKILVSVAKLTFFFKDLSFIKSRGGGRNFPYLRHFLPDPLRLLIFLMTPPAVPPPPIKRVFCRMTQFFLLILQCMAFKFRH